MTELTVAQSTAQLFVAAERWGESLARVAICEPRLVKTAGGQLIKVILSLEELLLASGVLQSDVEAFRDAAVSGYCLAAENYKQHAEASHGQH